MPNNYLYLCQGWCYSATFPVKYLFSRPLGGGGGVPRSVNGLNIYTFDLDCMFATVLYFPWVLHCFPRFSFVLIPFLTYVIILSWVCTAHFASRAIFDFSPYGQNVAELRGEAWTTILGRKQFRLWEVTWPLFTQKNGYYLSTIGGSKLALF